jgi:hypothetical protein
MMLLLRHGNICWTINFGSWKTSRKISIHYQYWNSFYYEEESSATSLFSSSVFSSSSSSTSTFTFSFSAFSFIAFSFSAFSFLTILFPASGSSRTPRGFDPFHISASILSDEFPNRHNSLVLYFGSRRFKLLFNHF